MAEMPIHELTLEEARYALLLQHVRCAQTDSIVCGLEPSEMGDTDIAETLTGLYKDIDKINDLESHIKALTGGKLP